MQQLSGRYNQYTSLFLKIMNKLQKNRIAGVILAGGNANRLDGIAKGMLQVTEGVSIIERLILELDRAEIKEVIISANDHAAYEVFGKEIVPDIRANVGPLAGIEAGLEYFADHSDAVVFLPCDLPYITARQVLTLKDAFITSRAQIVFAQTSEFFYHPLCVVVHNDLRESISSAIDEGHRKPQDVWRQLGASTVMFENDMPFFNINSFTDLNNWQSQIGCGKVIG